ncbi:UNVERIFIED_CONTAM: hypothetical protein RMT77_003722 [Armadillidium vulgare]
MFGIGVLESKKNREVTQGLALVLLIFCAVIFPVHSQIHWNRGWGAGGSVGKRSLFLPTNTFHEQKKSECSSQIFKFVSSLAKQIEREIENILICETEARLTLLEEVSSSELDEGESQISKIRPLWRTSKKVSDDKEQ